jgi:hypothetical protein
MNIKTITNLITSSGSLLLDHEFISVRLIKEAVQKKYRLIVLEESPTHMKCKIIRYARFYGAPMVFPNPSVQFVIKKQPEGNTLLIDYHWPDYYLLLVLTIAAGIISQDLFYTTFILLLFGIAVFLDTKWVSTRIKKIILNI